MRGGVGVEGGTEASKRWDESDYDTLIGWTAAVCKSEHAHPAQETMPTHAHAHSHEHASPGGMSNPGGGDYFKFGIFAQWKYALDDNRVMHKCVYDDLSYEWFDFPR